VGEHGKLDTLMDALGYHFKSIHLLELAVTHSSFRNEHKDLEGDNERLEFLGDAVLGAIISHMLVDHFLDQPEGVLTRYKAVLVSEHGLNRTALELNLGQYLRLGRGEEQTGGREKASVLSDTMEAVFAAVYLDGGFGAVQLLISRLYESRLKEVGGTEQHVDFKTKLQELAQIEYRALPTYAIVDFTGPDHDRQYSAIVSVLGEELAQGIGGSKKEAEQSAAMTAFEKISAKTAGPLP
jgi:ribonuclease-3